MGLLKLADKYSAERLEAACKKALSYTAVPATRVSKTYSQFGKTRIRN
jgi:hypothetical protein